MQAGFVIAREACVKGFGVTMWEEFASDDHIEATIASSRKITGGVMKTFETRHLEPVATLFKLLVTRALDTVVNLRNLLLVENLLQ